MKKQTLTLLLILVVGVGFSQREIPTLKPQSSEIYLSEPVSKKVATIEKRQSRRIYYTIGKDTFFWDFDTLREVTGGYLVITTFENGIEEQRFVALGSVISINMLR